MTTTKQNKLLLQISEATGCCWIEEVDEFGEVIRDGFHTKPGQFLKAQLEPIATAYNNHPALVAALEAMMTAAHWNDFRAGQSMNPLEVAMLKASEVLDLSTL